MPELLPLLGGQAVTSAPLLQDIKLYFALRPPPDAAAAIAGVMAEYGPRLPATARPHRAESWHVSLACLWRWSEPDPERVRRTLDEAAGIAAPPINLCFDRIGSFRGPRHEPGILALHAGQGAEDAKELARLISARCRAFGHSPSQKNPHLTLARAANLPFEMLARPIWLRATAFDLILVRGRQLVLGTFPLAAKAFPVREMPPPKAIGDLFDNSAHAPGAMIRQAPPRRQARETRRR